MSTSAKVRKSSSHVPAQFYGYSLQVTHMVYLLLDSGSGTTVSLEVLEDVASESSEGEVTAIQIKSAAKTNPIADRSTELWKTFSNWIEAATNGELDPDNTSFQIRLGKARRGSLCELLAKCNSLAESNAAIDVAKNEFFTKTGKARSGVGAELLDFVKKVFAPSCRALLAGLICRFSISAGNGHAYEELLEKMRAKFIDDELVEDVLLRALAWVKVRVDSAIEDGKPPIVSSDEFRKELIAFRDRLRARDYLPSFASKPSSAEIDLQRIRMFVQQLKLITFSEEQILHAISDFLIAKANRVQYADRGYVHPDSFTDFEEALFRLWMNHRDEIELQQDEGEEVRGKRLALRCLREIVKLQGIEVVPDFIRGCFHELADFPRIGWHPRYTSLLPKEETK